jgi:heat shock protein HslJ
MMKFLFALAFFLGLAACTHMDAVSDEPLLDRYWRVVEIDGKAIKVVSNHAEPHLILAAGSRAYGSDGCNRFNGSYDTTQGLRFGRMASTMMACMPPVDLLAREFMAALNTTASYRIKGQRMDLLDTEGRVRVRLEATFLK